MKWPLLVRMSMLFVVASDTIDTVHDFRRRCSLDLATVAAAAAAKPSVWIRASRDVRPLTGRQWGSAYQEFPRVSILETVPFPQSYSIEEKVTLGMRGGAIVSDDPSDETGIVLFLQGIVLFGTFFYVYNKILEGLWFYVVPRIWAFLMFRPFRPTFHKMSWKWWQPAFDLDHYVVCLVVSLVVALLLGKAVLFWIALLQQQVRNVSATWALVRVGSKQPGCLLDALLFTLFEQLVMLFILRCLVWLTCNRGGRFLAQVMQGNDRREKAIISIFVTAWVVLNKANLVP